MTHITTRQLTPGTRVLITNVRDYRGGGTSDYRPARNPRRASYQNAPGELAGIIAATVTAVTPPAAGSRHWTIRTNAAIVTGVVAAQRWRPAPDDMTDHADHLAATAADDARRAADRTSPRDIDGTPTNLGDVVELLHQGGGGRFGHPWAVAVVVAITIMGVWCDLDGVRRLSPRRQWRRLVPLAVGNDGTAAIRSCLCPAQLGTLTVHQHFCDWYSDHDRGVPVPAFTPHPDAVATIDPAADIQAATAAGVNFTHRRDRIQTFACPRPRCRAQVGASCTTPNGYLAQFHRERVALAYPSAKPVRARKHRLTDVQAEWIENAAEGGDHRVYAPDQYAALSGDAARRQTADALVDAGLLVVVDTVQGERVLELTGAGWSTYWTHTLVIRHGVPDDHPDTCPCVTTHPTRTG